MVMPPCGTFDYAVVVPKRPRDSAWVAKTRGAWPPLWIMNSLRDARLVGYSPRVQISGGRITLTAPGRRLATVRTVSLNVRPELVELLSTGDVLHLLRTQCGGLAAALIRRGKLVVAVGAVSNLPLGGGIDIRSALASNPGVPFWEVKEVPVEVTISGLTRRLTAGETVRLGDYDVHVAHGFLPGVPGIDESLAVVRADQCPLALAVESSWLLASGAEMVPW